MQGKKMNSTGQLQLSSFHGDMKIGNYVFQVKDLLHIAFWQRLLRVSAVHQRR